MDEQKYMGINRLFKLHSLQVLINKWYDGTFTDFFDDWKWIFSFSKKYKGIIVFYTVLGLVGSTLSLGASWVSKILINVIVEKQVENLWMLIAATVFSTVFSLVVGSLLSRLGLKISIYVNNDIQSTIFGKIIDAMVFLPLLYLFIGGYGTIIQSFFQLLAIVLIQGVLKTAVEIVLSPLVVCIVNRVKHYETSLT